MRIMLKNNKMNDAYVGIKASFSTEAMIDI